jgi:MFS superfamily sulfate permease-like transporter
VTTALIIDTSTLAFTTLARSQCQDGRQILLRMSDNDGINKNESNLLSALMNQLNTQINNRDGKVLIVVETDEQKQQRLRNERLAVIEAGEVRKTSRVIEDKNVYLFLFAMQFLPLIGNADRIESILYFFGMAVSTHWQSTRGD